jgi:hypothetical protein
VGFGSYERGERVCNGSKTDSIATGRGPSSCQMSVTRNNGSLQQAEWNELDDSSSREGSKQAGSAANLDFICTPNRGATQLSNTSPRPREINSDCHESSQHELISGTKCQFQRPSFVGCPMSHSLPIALCMHSKAVKRAENAIIEHARKWKRGRPRKCSTTLTYSWLSVSNRPRELQRSSQSLAW